MNQGVHDRGLMGPFNRGRHRRIGHRPQRGHRLHRRERQVVASNRLCLRPGIFRDLTRQFPGIGRLPAMLGEEKLAGHLGPRPRPISSRQRRVRRQAGPAVDRGNTFGHLEPERADDTIDDPERRAQLGHCLEVA